MESMRKAGRRLLDSLAPPTWAGWSVVDDRDIPMRPKKDGKSAHEDTDDARKEQDRRRQFSLVRRLMALPQPVALCYPHSKRAHFFMNLKSLVWTHADGAVGSASFYVDDVETDDCRAVFTGRLAGHAGFEREDRWQICVTPVTSGPFCRHQYEASLAIGTNETFGSHAIWVSSDPIPVPNPTRSSRAKPGPGACATQHS